MGVRIGNPTSARSVLSGYVINYNIPTGSKGGIIPIQFSPTSLSDNISANFNQTAIAGGSAPVITYSSTGARQVGLSFDVAIDYLPANSGFSNTEEYLNSFRALVYPKYEAGMVISPNCKLVLSNLEVEGVCTSCNIDYKTERYGNNGSMGASVSLSFLEVLNDVKGSVDIVNRGTNLLAESSNYSGANVSYASNNIISNSNREIFNLNGSTSVNCGIREQNGKKYLDYQEQGYRLNNSNYSIVPYSTVVMGNVTLNVSDLEMSGDTLKNKIGTLHTSQLTFTRNSTTMIATNKDLEDNKCLGIIVYVPYRNCSIYELEKAKIRYIYASR